MFHQQMVTPRRGHPMGVQSPRHQRWPDRSLLGGLGDPVKSSRKWNRGVSAFNPYLVLHGPLIDFCFNDHEAHKCAWDTPGNQSRLPEPNYKRMCNFTASGMSFEGLWKMLFCDKPK